MKLSYKRTILIGFAFMSILAFWQVYDQVIPYLLEKDFGLPTFWTNAIMAIDNVLAIFMLPLFGAISDKTNTRLGKRTPYILFGTIAVSLFIVLMAISQSLHKFGAFMLSLLVVLVIMSVYRSPAVAYMPDVTEKPLRSKANAVINLVGYIGGIFSTVVMMILLKSETLPDGSKGYKEGTSFLPVFLILVGFMLASVIVMTLTVKENKQPHVTDEPDETETAAKGKKIDKKVGLSLFMILLSVFFWFMAYNAVSTAFSRYCVEIWGADLSASSSYLLVGTVAAIAAFVPLGFVSSHLGRKKTIMGGIILMTACYVAGFFIREATPIMYVLFGLVGIGWAAINVNSFPMVVEMCKGSDIGKYTGIYYTFSMAAQIATPLLSGLLIETIKSAGYLMLFPYAAVFSGLAFVTMIFVKHGDNKPPKKKSIIENFDVDND
ncbi:MAG: MFS transporter [Clostridia bacterium]|nr:MFS transporter [Clostridia bacterium]